MWHASSVHMVHLNLIRFLVRFLVRFLRSVWRSKFHLTLVSFIVRHVMTANIENLLKVGMYLNFGCFFSFCKAFRHSVMTAKLPMQT